MIEAVNDLPAVYKEPAGCVRITDSRAAENSGTAADSEAAEGSSATADSLVVDPRDGMFHGSRNAITQTLYR